MHTVTIHKPDSAKEATETFPEDQYDRACRWAANAVKNGYIVKLDDKDFDYSEFMSQESQQ